MRTPVAYYVAQLMSSTGKCPTVVVGTGNKGIIYHFPSLINTIVNLII